MGRLLRTLQNFSYTTSTAACLRTILFEAGIDEKDAQELLDHANISVTRDIYTHIRSSRKEKIAEILNNFNG